MENGILARLKSKAKTDGIRGCISEVMTYSLRYACKPMNDLMLAVCRKLPLKKNYMVLESEGDYTDNVKTFYDYLISKGYNRKYKIIWFVHEPKKYPKIYNVKYVSRFHMGLNPAANYYSGVSKYFIFSHPWWLKNWRKEQVVVNTTHSVAALKMSSPPKDYKIFDYVLCCSPYCQKVKEIAFDVPAENIPILGIPRIDLMFKHKDCCKKLIPGYRGEKLILSMQTFKQSKKWNDSTFSDPFALNVVNSKDELMKLDSYLKSKNMMLVVKIHHLQDLSFLDMVQLDNIHYLTDDKLHRAGFQVNELLENADVLLTDYSSVFYEYLLKDRPIGFLIGDMEEYSRGFLMEDPLSEMPGEKVRSFGDLISFLDATDRGEDSFAAERKTIRDKVFTYQDNKNCYRFLKWLRRM